MKCPKCNYDCRLKMTGAVCLNPNGCNWSTHDRSLFIKERYLNSEQLSNDYVDMYSPFDGL